jgi:hypothetical protein
MMAVAGEANQIFRPVTMFDYGIRNANGLMTKQLRILKAPIDQFPKRSSKQICSSRKDPFKSMERASAQVWATESPSPK